MFNGQLVIGTLAVLAMVAFHIACLVGLAGMMRRWAASSRLFSRSIGLVMLLGITVTVIIGIHTAEA